MAQISKRLEGVYSTATDLLAAEDIESVLARITERAARAVNAPRYLLVVETSPGERYQLHHHGFTEAEAHELAHELLEKQSDETDDSRLVVDIASSRRRYGRLAAVYPEGMRFFAQERQILTVYADYAATALDVVTSLDEARRSNATASSLLDFSRALSGMNTVDDVARQLAETVPTVTGCDGATVMLWEPESASLTVRASSADGAPLSARDGDVGVGRPHLRVPAYVRRRFAVRRQTHFVISCAATDATASVVAPLFRGSELVGIVTADFSRDAGTRPTTDVDLHERLTGLGDQAVTALQNARLLEQVSHMAWHDALTGLPNRRLLEDRVNQELSRAQRISESVCMFFVDLDRFKQVNDTLGHAAGDELIVQVAHRLSETLRGQDTVARFGGDEFAVLLPGVSDPSAAAVLANRALENLSQPYVVAGQIVHSSASSASPVAPFHGNTYDELLSNADAAMYHAKSVGRNTFHVFGSGQHFPAGDLQLESDLHRAIERGELFVLYQPFIDLNTAVDRRRRSTGPVASPHPRRPRAGRVHPPGRAIGIDRVNRQLDGATGLSSAPHVGRRPHPHPATRAERVGTRPRQHPLRRRGGTDHRKNPHRPDVDRARVDRALRGGRPQPHAGQHRAPRTTGRQAVRR